MSGMSEKSKQLPFTIYRRLQVVSKNPLQAWAVEMVRTVWLSDKCTVCPVFRGDRKERKREARGKRMSTPECHVTGPVFSCLCQSNSFSCGCFLISVSSLHVKCIQDTLHLYRGTKRVWIGWLCFFRESGSPFNCSLCSEQLKEPSIRAKERERERERERLSEENKEPEKDEWN